MELENKILTPNEWFDSDNCKNENLWLNIQDYVSYILAEQSHFIYSNSWRGFEVPKLAEEFNRLISAKTNKTEINCTGNNGNGCYMDSCGHNCGCEGIK